MISANVLHALRTICQTGYKLGPISFEWQPGTNTLVRTNSHWRRGISFLISVYTFANFCFMSVRWVQAFFFMHIPYRRLVMNAFNIITHLIGSAFYLNTFLYHRQVQRFIFNLMRTNKAFQSTFSETSSYVEQKNQVSVVRRVFIPVYGYSIVQFFIAIRQIDNPKYVWSLFNMTQVPIPCRIPIGLFESYISACLATKLLFYVCVYMAYLQSTIPCLQVLRDQPVHVFAKYYKHLLLVNRLFHRLVQRIILPLIVGGMIIFTSVSIYSTIKLYGEIRFPGILGFPAISVGVSFLGLYLLPASYKVYEISRDILHHDLELVNRDSHQFKLLKACHPLQIHLGPYYRIRGSHFFILYMYAILEFSINLLLTF